MIARGGWQTKPATNTLTPILERWKFTWEHKRDGNVWIAPALPKLREEIEKQYPAVKWRDPTLAEWLPDDWQPTDRQRNREMVDGPF
jgi:transposase